MRANARADETISLKSFFVWASATETCVSEMKMRECRCGDLSPSI